jgi:hypothetical protein
VGAAVSNETKNNPRGYHQRFKTDMEKFEEKIMRTPTCWAWRGAVNKNGYGGFYFEGRPQTASRVAYKLFVGVIPDGMGVLHRCDNPLCIRPDHLFLGTDKDNAEDRHQKGRDGGIAITSAGESNVKAKLTIEQVEEIRNSTIRTGILANHYLVHRTTIQRIRSGKGWSNV